MVLTDSEAKHIKWWDYLWFLIPIAGMVAFVAAVVARAREAEESE